MKSTDNTRLNPPRLAAWLVRASAPAEERADVLADLADELNEHASRVGAAAARRWYWRQALGSIVPLVRPGAPADSETMRAYQRVARVNLWASSGTTSATRADRYERIGASVNTQRFRTTMMATFAVLAGLLASLGVYAVRSRAIRARRREIGVRAALGATRRQILALLVGQGLRLVLVGMAIGLAGAVWSTRIVRQWLFATEATDPALLVIAAGLLGGTALLAGWLPARQAAAIDPLVSLRHE